MLKFWLCFLSFFYTVNSFSTEEEKVKKKCGICWEKFEENDSSSLIKSKEIFSCNCNEDLLICKKCILKLIGEKINSRKEEELTENNEKIKILEIIFGYIKDGIENINNNNNFQNNNLREFVEYIIKEKEKIEEKENEEKMEDENIKIGEYKKLNAEENLVYRTINKIEDENGNTIFYIGNEQDPTKKLKFIKSFLSLLEKFSPESHSLFTGNIELSIWRNCQQKMKIKEIEKWEEKDFKIEVSCELDTTELQKKIKNEKVISIKCPFCNAEIKKESDFFLKICGEPFSQESSKKLSCLEYCGNICSDCC